MSVADASEKVEISVLVPVMNEAGNIRPLMNEIAAVFAGRSFEILYINDGSTDNTAKELAEAGAAIVHLHARNPDNGLPDQTPEAFMKFLPQIKARRASHWRWTCFSRRR